MRLGAPPTSARTFCRFGSKRRLVATIEWLREFPNELLCSVERCICVDSDAVAAGGEFQHDRATDADGAAGDECDGGFIVICHLPGP